MFNRSDSVIKRIGRFIPVGHRGANGELPGNTIGSFQRFIDIFPEGMLELDVWRTSDNEIVVYHDELLDHETNGTGKIIDYTFKEIRRLDRGYNVSHDGGLTFPFRGKGFKVPLLKEVLERFPQTPVSIDIKFHMKDFARQVIELLEEYDSAGRVILGSFNNGLISYIKKNFPEMPTSFSKKEIFLFYILHKILPRSLIKFSGTALMIPEILNESDPEYSGSSGNRGIRIITRQLIRKANRAGIPVLAWTINRRENMERLISWGINGIITDYPTLLKEVMMERGIC